jgi:hypothetical protein
MTDVEDTKHYDVLLVIHHSRISVVLARPAVADCAPRAARSNPAPILTNEVSRLLDSAISQLN